MSTNNLKNSPQKKTMDQRPSPCTWCLTGLAIRQSSNGLFVSHAVLRWELGSQLGPWPKDARFTEFIAYKNFIAFSQLRTDYKLQTIHTRPHHIQHSLAFISTRKSCRRSPSVRPPIIYASTTSSSRLTQDTPWIRMMRFPCPIQALPTH
jgi:hypothetical protein